RAGVGRDAAVGSRVERTIELEVTEEVFGRASAAFEEVFAVLEAKIVAIDVLQVAFSLEALRIGRRCAYVDGARLAVEGHGAACVGVGAQCHVTAGAERRAPTPAARLGRSEPHAPLVAGFGGT